MNTTERKTDLKPIGTQLVCCYNLPCNVVENKDFVNVDLAIVECTHQEFP